MLLDDMGLGKTVQTIIAFKSLGAKRVLIICPPAVLYSWAEEIERWAKGKYQVHILKGRLAKVPTGAGIVVICPYSIVAAPAVYDQLYSTKWGVMVLDEIHYCKNSRAKRTKAVLGKQGIVKTSVFTWGLSGTLMPNTPVDLWTVFASLGRKFLGKYDNWMKFTQRYCGRYKTPFGWDVSGAKNLSELRKRLFDTGFALMRHKTDVLKELPPKQYRLMPIEGDNLSVKTTDTLASTDFDKATLGIPGAELAEARHEVGMAKLAPALDYIKMLLDIVDKVVVFAWHKDVVTAIQSGLYLDDIDSVYYYGEQTSAQKEAAKQTFLSDEECRVFIGNIASAGTGLNGLQTVASHVVFVETPWTYTEIAQASDRLHRFGQKNPTTVDLLVLRDSPEDYIMRQVLKKEGYFKETFNGSTQRSSQGHDSLAK